MEPTKMKERIKKFNSKRKQRGNAQYFRKKRGSGGKGRGPIDSEFPRRFLGYRGKSQNRLWLRRAIALQLRERKDKTPKDRELICNIYLDTVNQELAEKFYDVLLEVAEEIDFEIKSEFPVIISSWIKGFILRSQKALSSREVRERFEKVERAIELQQIEQVQSVIDKNINDAIARLMEASKDIPNICTIAGSLLFVKTTVNGKSSVFAQNLSHEQLMILRYKPSLLHDPIHALEALEEHRIKTLEAEKSKRLQAS